MKTKLVNGNFTSDYTDNLLMARGLDRTFLDYFYNVPNDDALQNPIDLKDIDLGVQNLHEAIKMKDHFVIVVDSDVDGFTSAAIIGLYIKKIDCDANIDHVLHKGKGHGLSDTIDEVLELNPDFVILPDSSTNDKEYHDRLGEEGAYCLVLDHHLSESDDYSSYATIINNQISPKYINKNLSGAGVAWQFCRRYDQIYHYDYADNLIDLAALGIVSDMMSVLELENRYIINRGFSHVNNFFFKALCEKQSFSMGGKVTPITVAFYITPLINAMIRVGTQEEKERCFKAFINGKEIIPSNKRGHKGEPVELAIESARECTNARAKQNRILDKVEDELEIKIYKYDLLENKVLFIKLEDEDFPPELNGLVAMRLSARYKRPTIVARVNDEGEVKGSQRGLNESELKSFKNFLDESGYCTFTAGHDNASGVGIMEQNINDFLDYANDKLKDIDFGENWYEINFSRYGASTDLNDLIRDLASHDNIWGQFNAQPLIEVRDINIKTADVQVMGRYQDTVKIVKNGIAYMFFKCSQRLDEFAQFNDMKINLVGRANLNTWMGNTTPQIFVTDFEVLDNRLGF